ncbi:hypothetical protein ACIVBQ_000546 [Tenacibaculum discolor]
MAKYLLNTGKGTYGLGHTQISFSDDLTLYDNDFDNRITNNSTNINHNQRKIYNLQSIIYSNAAWSTNTLAPDFSNNSSFTKPIYISYDTNTLVFRLVVDTSKVDIDFTNCDIFLKELNTRGLSSETGEDIRYTRRRKVTSKPKFAWGNYVYYDIEEYPIDYEYAYDSINSYIKIGIEFHLGYQRKTINDNTKLEKVGGTVSGDLILDPLESDTNIAGSNLTVKKQSTSTGTNVSQFIDVDRKALSTPSNTSTNTYGLVSRVVNNSTVEDAGFTGSNLVGRNSSSSNFNFAYGTINSAEALGSGNGNFVASTVNRSKVTGSATIDYLRGTGSTTTIGNAGAIVNYMQGHHNSLVFTNGSVGQADVLYLDIDTGSAIVTGDLAYIRAGNDTLPTVNGNAYFIKSESNLPSEFSGSIKASVFIGDGSQLENVLKKVVTTFSNLPNLPSIGDKAVITDAGTVTYRGIASGGGTNVAQVLFDGTQWIYQ